MRRFLFALALLPGLAACAGSDSISPGQPPNFLSAAPRIIAETDWSAPEAVTIRLTNYAFQPNELTLHRDRATRLIFVNATTVEHSMVSDEFFREVATKQVVGPTGTQAAPWLSKIVIPAGQTKELWLVPARYGAFSFKSGEIGYPALGMTGLINVVP